jgi:6-phosphofructokinase 1
MVILSEGAEWQGYRVKEYGEADAFGHRKKMSVAEDLSGEIKRATGEGSVISDLTYDLRSGSPDFVDRLVAFTFAGMAMDAMEEAKSGLMTAINEGHYSMVAIPDPNLGPRKVDIASMYDIECYRPTYDHKIGLPIFLARP